MAKSHIRGLVTVSSWVSFASSATRAVEAARATVRPSASLTADRISTSRAVPDAFTTDVSTRTTARSSLTRGVVTYVPQRRTCTGSVTTRRTSR